jgi:hypothetical protein
LDPARLAIGTTGRLMTFAKSSALFSPIQRIEILNSDAGSREYHARFLLPIARCKVSNVKASIFQNRDDSPETSKSPAPSASDGAWHLAFSESPPQKRQNGESTGYYRLTLAWLPSVIPASLPMQLEGSHL